jgi:hypothetical protein
VGHVPLAQSHEPRSTPTDHPTRMDYKIHLSAEDVDLPLALLYVDKKISFEASDLYAI